MISINNNVVLNMSFPIKVAPGKTVAIIHGVAQRNMSQSADPKVLARAFRDFTNRKWLAGIPRELLRCAVNMRAGSGMADSLSIDDLGIPAGNSDVLAIGEETRLTGRAACGAMKLKTKFGEKELPLESVLAIAGGSYTKGPVRVFLRDGQILAGELSAEGLCFTLTSGITLNLDPSQLDRLVMRESATPDAVVSDGAEAFVETGAGERLAIAGLAETRLPVVSPWGSRPVAMTEILQLAALRDGLPGWKIMLRDGSKFFAMLDAHEVKLKTVLFGEQTFSLTTPRALNAGQMPEELEPEGAYFELEGDNRIVASLDCPTLDISLDGEMVSVPPTQIRHLAHAEDGPDNAFLIQLWDGGVMSGRIRQTALPLRVGDSLWQVPIGSIVSQVSSTPVISDSLRDRIDKLIRQLGDPDWRLREKASVELGELGYLARQQLSETVQLTDDAEVKRRAEALMEGLK